MYWESISLPVRNYVSSRNKVSSVNHAQHKVLPFIQCRMGLWSVAAVIHVGDCWVSLDLKFSMVTDKWKAFWVHLATLFQSIFLQGFVVFVTMCREAYDDFVRFRRDREVNSQKYKKLTKKG